MVTLTGTDETIFVESAGSVNDDMIIGAPSANDYAGESYVVFGGQNGWGGAYTLSLSGVDKDRFEIVEAQLKLKSDLSANYRSHSL